MAGRQGGGSKKLENQGELDYRLGERWGGNLKGREKGRWASGEQAESSGYTGQGEVKEHLWGGGGLMTRALTHKRHILLR